MWMLNYMYMGRSRSVDVEKLDTKYLTIVNQCTMYIYMYICKCCQKSNTFMSHIPTTLICPIQKSQVRQKQLKFDYINTLVFFL